MGFESASVLIRSSSSHSADAVSGQGSRDLIERMLRGVKEPATIVEIFDVHRLSLCGRRTITIMETSVTSANAHIAQLWQDPGPAHP